MRHLKELRWNRTGAYNDNLLPTFFAHTRTKLQHLELKGSDSWWPEESSSLWQLCLRSGATFPLPSLRSLTVIFPDRLGINTLISMASKVKLTSHLVRCDFGDHTFKSQDVDGPASRAPGPRRVRRPQRLGHRPLGPVCAQVDDAQLRALLGHEGRDLVALGALGAQHLKLMTTRTRLAFAALIITLEIERCRRTGTYTGVECNHCCHDVQPCSYPHLRLPVALLCFIQNI